MPEHARNASGLGIHKAETSLEDAPHSLDYIALFNGIELFLRYKSLHVFSGCIVHENSAPGQCCQVLLPELVSRVRKDFPYNVPGHFLSHPAVMN